MVQSARSLTFSVEKLRDIPTLSVVVTKLMEMVNDPKTSANQIAQVLKKDQILTAKVLRLVNSAYYNLSTEVTDVTKALGFLGFNTVSVLVLGTSVFSSFDIKAAPYFNVMEFWKHSLSTALAGELIATRLKVARPQDAFTCGLLHDLGKIALFKVATEDLKEVIEKAQNENLSFIDAETALGLPGHTVIGERLAEQWKLPVVIRKTIRFHHRDITEMESIYPQMKPTIMIASIADVMSNRLNLGFSGNNTTLEYSESYLKQLNLSIETLTEIENQMNDEMDRVNAFLAATRS